MTETKLLPQMDMTEAGTGKLVTIVFDGVQEMKPVSLPREAYGFHRKPGGATGLQAHDEYYEGGNEIDGTVISLNGLRTVTVLHSIEEIREGRDAGIASLHMNADLLRRIDTALRADAAEKNDGPHDVLKGFGTDEAQLPGNGRTETVERESLEVKEDLKTGRPIDGSDPAPRLVQVLGKKPPIRLGTGMPVDDLKAG